MTALWVIPPAVVVLGSVPVGMAAVRLAAELRALRHDLERWSSVRPSVAEIGHELDGLRARVESRPAR